MPEDRLTELEEKYRPLFCPNCGDEIDVKTIVFGDENSDHAITWTIRCDCGFAAKIEMEKDVTI